MVQKSKMKFETLSNFYYRWRDNLDEIQEKFCTEKENLRNYSNLVKISLVRPDDKDLLNTLWREYTAFAKDICKATEIIPQKDLEELNVYLVLSRAQQRTHIDLGVCEFLDTKIRKKMRQVCLKAPEQDITPQCSLGKASYYSGGEHYMRDIFISKLELCMFNERNNCSLRQEHFAKCKLRLANNKGVMIGLGK
ncbi:hypothetical protein J4465_02345 [Candidatus Pacearchaeota archaeon]|nr:hypothetical protein [Candidatus Pacearchaeota archaeon]